MIQDTSTGPAPVAAATARPVPPRRWDPTPAIRFTALFQAAGLVSLAALPELWPPIVAGLAANHAVLFTASVLPRSQLIGRNLVRLPEVAARRGEVAITFDDGPDPEVTPRVLDCLDARGAKASFFCVGERALAVPELVQEIVRRGHSIENHSHRHSTALAWYGPWRLRRELAAAQAALAGTAGAPPRFFRAPYGMRSPFVDPVLARLGLTCVSWTRRGYDTLDADATRVLRRLVKGLAPGDLLLLHDGMASLERRGDPTVLAVLPRLLERLADRGLKPVSLRMACDA